MDVGEIVPDHNETLVDSCESSMAPSENTSGVSGGDSSRDDPQGTDGKQVGRGPSTDSPELEQHDVLHRDANDSGSQIFITGVNKLRDAIKRSQLSRVIELHIYDKNIGKNIASGYATVAEALASGKMSVLEDLYLSNSGLTGDMCVAICNALTSGNCPSLDYIHFSWNKIESKGVEALGRAIESRNLVKLKFLVLDATDIDDNSLATLATALHSGESSPLPNLKILSLRDNLFSAMGMQQLAEVFKSGRLKSLESLNLVGNKLGDVGIQHLAEAITSRHLEKLTHLYLINIGMTNDGMATLAKALQYGDAIVLPNLKILNVSWNFFNDVGLRHLAEALKSGRLDSLETLYLGGCDLSGENRDILVSAFIENRYLTLEVAPTFHGQERLREGNKRRKEILDGLISSPVVPATVGKVYLCGNPKVGKTTLSHSLQRTFLETMWTRERKPHEEERTRGIDVSRISSKGTKYIPFWRNPMTLHLWDMAGQEEYHLVHHSFFADLDETKATTFLIVCTSEDLNESEKQLQYWLKFIASSSDTTHGLRHVFSVLNKKVQNGGQEDQDQDRYAERWQNVLHAEREKFTGLLEVESQLFWIDVRARESVHGLKKCLLAHSRKVLRNKQVPELCETLQKYLAKWSETRKQLPVLHWEEFLKKCTQEPRLFKWSEEEIGAGVKYLNEVGVLIHVDKFPQDCGIPYKRLLVLDPNWICRIVIGNMLLSEDMVRKTEREDLFRDQVNKTTGAISIPNVKRFFHSLLGGWNDSQFDDLISIILWLGLCYKGGDGMVYIPSLIDKKAELANEWHPSGLQGHDGDSWVMGYSVEREESDKTLAPMSLWHKFQVGLAQNQKFNGVLDNFFTAGKTFMTFTVDQMHVKIDVDAREDIPTFDEITIFVKPISRDQWDGDIRKQSQVDLAHDLLNILLLQWDTICPAVKYVCKVVWPWPASESRPTDKQRRPLQVTELKRLVQEKGFGTHMQCYSFTYDQLLSTNDKIKAVQSVVQSKETILKEAMIEAVELGIYPPELKASQITPDAVGVSFQPTGMSNNGVSSEESERAPHEVEGACHNMTETDRTLQAIQALMREVRETRREVVDKVDKVDNHLYEIKNMIQEGFSKVLREQEKVFGKLQETQSFLIEEKHRTCPNLIYLGEEDSGRWAKLKQVLTSALSVSVRLQFACEAMHSTYEPHKVKDQEGIQVSALHPVLKKIAPWLKVSLTIFLTSAKIATNVVVPGLGMILPDMSKLHQAASLLDRIAWATGYSNDELDKLMRKEIGIDVNDAVWNPRDVYGASRAAITELIGDLQPKDYKKKLGLRKVCLKYSDGSFHGVVWICEECLKKFLESDLVTEV